MIKEIEKACTEVEKACLNCDGNEGMMNYEWMNDMMNVIKRYPLNDGYFILNE